VNLSSIQTKLICNKLIIRNNFFTYTKNRYLHYVRTSVESAIYIFVYGNGIILLDYYDFTLHDKTKVGLNRVPRQLWPFKLIHNVFSTGCTRKCFLFYKCLLRHDVVRNFVSSLVLVFVRAILSWCP